MERGEILRALLSGFILSRPHVLGIDNEVELLVEMLTEIDGETKDEWIDRHATIIKVESNRFHIHCEGSQGISDWIEWFELAHVCQALREFSYSMPRHGGMPCEDASTARQVGPILDQGLLNARIYDLMVCMSAA